MTAAVWSNCTIDVQSALATAVTVDTLSKADPAVLEYTGTDPSNGNYMLLTGIAGMTQMNNRVVRVANVDTVGDDFECEGIDSTNYGTLSGTGSAQVITFGTTLGTIGSVNASGGGARTVEQSVIHTNQIITRRVAIEPFEISFESFYDLSDASLIALKEASEVSAKRAVRITLENGNILAFYADVTCSLIPTGSSFDNVLTTVAFNAVGFLSVWAS